VTRLSLADKIGLNLAGSPVPGAGMQTEAHYAPSVQIGRLVSQHFAVSLTAGIPPHIKIDGAKTLLPYGRLAETTYGPASLTLQYRPVRQGAWQPYLGAGASYMMIFSTRDAAFKNVEIDNDLAPVFEGGTDIMFDGHHGAFVEVKKSFLRTHASGTFGGAAVASNVRFDPWAISTGVVLRF
jgi:outer membrane protein